MDKLDIRKPLIEEPLMEEPLMEEQPEEWLLEDELEESPSEAPETRTAPLAAAPWPADEAGPATPLNLVTVRFQPAGKAYHFILPDNVEVEPGHWVVVETTYGTQVGRVVCTGCPLPAGLQPRDLKPVLRLASGLDMARYQLMQERSRRLMEVAREELRTLGAGVKVVAAEFALEGDQALLFCEGTLAGKDQPTLRQRLASRLDCRVELRFVGPRDHAKALGGYGVCGEPRCCARFLTEFQAVSIRMAKDQSIPMSPTDITGICGRLRCCLAYEHKVYKEESADFPKRKSLVQTPKGVGKVVDWDILKREVIVEIPPEGPREERSRLRFALDEVTLCPK